MRAELLVQMRCSKLMLQLSKVTRSSQKIGSLWLVEFEPCNPVIVGFLFFFLLSGATVGGLQKVGYFGFGGTDKAVDSRRFALLTMDSGVCGSVDQIFEIDRVS